MAQQWTPTDGRIPPCIDCGGPNVLGPQLEAPGGAVVRRLRMRRRQFNRLNTFVCLGCGRVKLYVDDVTSLRRYAQANPDEFRW
jgi:predicted nucleic-acid-binding Zn-ribbon protein